MTKKPKPLPTRRQIMDTLLRVQLSNAEMIQAMKRARIQCDAHLSACRTIIDGLDRAIDKAEGRK